MKFITILTLFVILLVALIGVQGDDKKGLSTPCKHYCKHLQEHGEKINRPDGCVCPHEVKTTVNASSDPTKLGRITTVVPVLNILSKELEEALWIVIKQAKPKFNPESKPYQVEHEIALMPILNILDKSLKKVTSVVTEQAKSTVKPGSKSTKIEPKTAEMEFLNNLQDLIKNLISELNVRAIFEGSSLTKQEKQTKKIDAAQ
uniref:DUF148 domain-containing protein n=1 Tax=Parastrongyloides trichosuri TaxID=131310 RepID=A0A0N4ZLL4_PARTI